MSRIAAASLFVLTFAFFLAPAAVFADAADNMCPAANGNTTVYNSKKPTGKYTQVTNGVTVTITNYYGQKCSESCPSGVSGTIVGKCTAKTTCGDKNECNGQTPPGTPSSQQLQNATPGSGSTPAVSPDTGGGPSGSGGGLPSLPTPPSPGNPNPTPTNGLNTNQSVAQQAAQAIDQLFNPTPVADQNTSLTGGNNYSGLIGQTESLSNTSDLSGGAVNGIEAQQTVNPLEGIPSVSQPTNPISSTQPYTQTGGFTPVNGTSNTFSFASDFSNFFNPSSISQGIGNFGSDITSAASDIPQPTPVSCNSTCMSQTFNGGGWSNISPQALQAAQGLTPDTGTSPSATTNTGPSSAVTVPAVGGLENGSAPAFTETPDQGTGGGTKIFVNSNGIVFAVDQNLSNGNATLGQLANSLGGNVGSTPQNALPLDYVASITGGSGLSDFSINSMQDMNAPVPPPQPAAPGDMTGVGTYQVQVVPSPVSNLQQLVDTPQYSVGSINSSGQFVAAQTPEGAEVTQPAFLPNSVTPAAPAESASSPVASSAILSGTVFNNMPVFNGNWADTNTIYGSASSETSNNVGANGGGAEVPTAQPQPGTPEAPIPLYSGSTPDNQGPPVLGSTQSGTNGGGGPLVPYNGQSVTPNEGGSTAAPAEPGTGNLSNPQAPTAGAPVESAAGGGLATPQSPVTSPLGPTSPGGAGNPTEQNGGAPTNEGGTDQTANPGGQNTAQRGTTPTPTQSTQPFQAVPDLNGAKGEGGAPAGGSTEPSNLPDGNWSPRPGNQSPPANENVQGNPSTNPNDPNLAEGNPGQATPEQGSEPSPQGTPSGSGGSATTPQPGEDQGQTGQGQGSEGQGNGGSGAGNGNSSSPAVSNSPSNQQSPRGQVTAPSTAPVTVPTSNSNTGTPGSGQPLQSNSGNSGPASPSANGSTPVPSNSPTPVTNNNPIPNFNYFSDALGKFFGGLFSYVGANPASLSPSSIAPSVVSPGGATPIQQSSGSNSGTTPLAQSQTTAPPQQTQQTQPPAVTPTTPTNTLPSATPLTQSSQQQLPSGSCPGANCTLTSVTQPPASSPQPVGNSLTKQPVPVTQNPASPATQQSPAATQPSTLNPQPANNSSPQQIPPATVSPTPAPTQTVSLNNNYTPASGAETPPGQTPAQAQNPWQNIINSQLGLTPQTISYRAQPSQSSGSQPESVQQMKNDVETAQQGLTCLQNATADDATAKTCISNGIAAASRIGNSISGPLSQQIRQYVAAAQRMGADYQTYQNCYMANGCDSIAKGLSLYNQKNSLLSTGNALLPQVSEYLAEQRNQPPAAVPKPTPGPATSGTSVIARPTVIAGSGLQPPRQQTPPQETPSQTPPAGAPAPTQSPSPLPGSGQPFSGPATVPTPVGKVVAQLPGADQMGPITHNGMPAAQAAKEIGTTYYTKELTNFNDIKCASGTCPNNQPGIAHRTWPLGSQVQVCNTNNGKCAVATIIDRGPATWLTNRTIDANPALTNAIGLNGLNPATYKLLSVPGIAQTAQPTGVALAPCNNQGCAPPTPNAKVAAASVPGVTSVPNCSSAGGICATDPTTGASFACQGDQAACQGKLQQQVALSRLCASNPATCGSGAGTYTAKQSGTTQQQPVPRQIIPIRSAYGTMGKLAKNPNVPTVSGVSNQDLINRIRAAGVNVDDQSSNLSNYPHGKNQMTALTWHGDVLPGSKLAPYEAQQNRAGKAAAQAVLSEDGTLHIVAPLDAETFHAATMNKLGPGIEIAGADNGKEPTAAQIQSMKAITDIVMNQLGWEVGTHGQIEPSHREALEAGAATVNYVYQGTSPAAQAVYGITDANGNPVAGANGQPLTTTQAPGASGTLQFLTNPDGSIYIDPSNGQPVPVPTVQLTQDPTNPNQYNAPDNRPPQAAPANPWPPGTNGYPNRQYAPEYPQPTQIGQPSQIGGGAPSFPRIPAQPPQTPIAQQIQQPLPQPVMTQSIPPASPITPTGTTTPATPVVSIIANPSAVTLGETSLISWSSVGAVSCAVGPQNSQLIGTSTNGTVNSAPLTTSTVFIATCQTQASTAISASTTVLVQ